MDSADRQRRDAAGKTAMDSIGRKISPKTKRMAGVALGAALTPSVMMMLDNQEESFMDQLISGAITAGGIGVGGYMGMQGGALGEAETEAYINDGLDQLKTEAKEVAKTKGPAAGVEHYAKGKELLMEYVKPIDPNRSGAFNNYMREIPEFGPMIADLNIPSRTPRQMKHLSRGAMLGALASAPLAYQALRGGEIVE